MANPSIIIGRTPHGQQPKELKQTSISRTHCRLTRIGNTSFEIEDLGSKYGTRVNGLPIVKSVVELDTPIMLADYETTVRELLNLSPASKPIPGPTPAPAKEISVASLKYVYENYLEAQKDMMKKRNSAQLKRMMPMSLGMPLIMCVLGVIPFDAAGNMGLIIKGGLMVVLLGLCVALNIRMFSVVNNQADEQIDLNRKFQTDYVCPSCKNFFGAAKPYEALLNQGQCPYCKSRFKESKQHNHG